MSTHSPHISAVSTPHKGHSFRQMQQKGLPYFTTDQQTSNCRNCQCYIHQIPPALSQKSVWVWYINANWCIICKIKQLQVYSMTYLIIIISTAIGIGVNSITTSYFCFIINVRVNKTKFKNLRIIFSIVAILSYLFMIPKCNFITNFSYLM